MASLPSKFANVTLLPRDVRVDVKAKLSGTEPTTSELKTAILYIIDKLEVAGTGSQQNFLKLSSSLQATQNTMNLVIDYLTDMDGRVSSLEAGPFLTGVVDDIASIKSQLESLVEGIKI